jgi:hypothetical protein
MADDRFATLPSDFMGSRKKLIWAIKLPSAAYYVTIYTAL